MTRNGMGVLSNISREHFGKAQAIKKPPLPAAEISALNHGLIPVSINQRLGLEAFDVEICESSERCQAFAIPQTHVMWWLDSGCCPDRDE